MNPPFARQADIHHVNHALKFLKPDGLLVSVMSAGVTLPRQQADAGLPRPGARARR
jgi:16S rRNA G1207 methylase RsmC